VKRAIIPTSSIPISPRNPPTCRTSTTSTTEEMRQGRNLRSRQHLHFDVKRSGKCKRECGG
jgi:hypothetical protein